MSPLASAAFSSVSYPSGVPGTRVRPGRGGTDWYAIIVLLPRVKHHHWGRQVAEASAWAFHPQTPGNLCKASGRHAAASTRPMPASHLAGVYGERGL